jgi:hypothetical protein
MTASYLQNNDYTAIQMRRPYVLQNNDVAQTVATMKGAWDDGARRVKAQYENVAGLQLITDENKKVTSEFLKSSREQLKKLSTQDLGDRSVQNNGISMINQFFDPNNGNYQNVLQESNVVGILNSEDSKAESFRTKDNGIGYNIKSHENIKYQKSILSKLNNSTAWKSVANELQSYVPYTDISKEMIQIKKAVTERIKQESSLEGGDWYIKTITREGIPEHVLKNAIEEMGSPALKAQLREEGRNTFYKKLLSDHNSVDNYYSQLGNSFFDQQVSDISVQKALAERELALLDKTDPNYKNASDYYNQTISTIDQTKTNVELQREKYLSTLSGLGNIQNVSLSLQKLDLLNEQMGINSLAKNLAYENITQNELSSNPAKIAFENMQQARMRLQFDMTKFDEEKEQFRMKYEQEERKIAAENETGTSEMGSIFGGGVYNQPVASTMTPNDLEKIGKEAIDGAFSNLNNDAELTASFLTSVLGDNGSFYSILQNNVKNQVPIKELSGVEAMGITDKLSEFVKHYVADQDLKFGVLNIPKGTDKERIKVLLSNFTPSQINQFLPQVLGANRNYVTKAVKSFAGEAASVEFRSILDDADMKRENFNTTLLPELKRNLGAYGKYIDGYSEKDIRNAWEKMPESEKVVYEKSEVSSSGTGNFWNREESNVKSIQITKEEYEKNKDNVKFGIGSTILYSARVINFNNFKDVVSPIINRTIGEKVVNNYGKQQTITYTGKQITNNQHTRDFEELKTQLKIAGDENGDIREILEKVGSMDMYRGFNIKSTNVNSKTATIDIIIEDKQENLKPNEKAKLKNIPIASASLSPKWNTSGSSLDTKKTYGSILAGSTSISKTINNKDFAYIKVMNNATTADIQPLITTNIPFIKIADQVVQVKDLLENVATKYGFSSFSDMLIKDPTKAQREISVIMNYYENKN